MVNIRVCYQPEKSPLPMATVAWIDECREILLYLVHLAVNRLPGGTLFPKGRSFKGILKWLYSLNLLWVKYEQFLTYPLKYLFYY